MKHNALESWTCEKAAELYGIRNWSSGYFDISPEGYVVARLRRDSTETVVRLMDVVSGLSERGLKLPVLLRFSDILDSRIALLNDTSHPKPAGDS